MDLNASDIAVTVKLLDAYMRGSQDLHIHCKNSIMNISIFVVISVLAFDFLEGCPCLLCVPVGYPVFSLKESKAIF